MTYNESRAESAPGEKKVWRPESVVIVEADKEKGLDPSKVYFLAIEELQGAWVDGEWEEAESSEEWTEDILDDNGHVLSQKHIRKDIPRARRYVLKYFREDGSVANAYSGGYSAKRRYS